MSKKITENDLARFALALREDFETHDLPMEIRYSLASAISFRIAALIDEKTGSTLHEGIDLVLDKYIDEFSKSPESPDHLVGELEIIFNKGKKVELNILKSQIELPDELRIIIEVVFGLRSTDALESEIDTRHGLSNFLRRKDGIKALRFNQAANVDRPKWINVPLPDPLSEEVYGSVAGLTQYLLKSIRPWV